MKRNKWPGPDNLHADKERVKWIQIYIYTEERVLQGCFFLSNLFKLSSDMILRGQENLSVFNLGESKHNNVPTQTTLCYR